VRAVAARMRRACAWRNGTGGVEVRCGAAVCGVRSIDSIGETHTQAICYHPSTHQAHGEI